MIFRGILICPYYDIRAYIRHDSTSKRCRRKNRQQYAGPLRRRFHPPHLHPRNPPKAGAGRREDGKLHAAGQVNVGQKRAERLELPARKYPAVSSPTRVWVRVWVKSQNSKQKPRAKGPKAVLKICAAKQRRQLAFVPVKRTAEDASYGAQSKASISSRLQSVGPRTPAATPTENPSSRRLPP